MGIYEDKNKDHNFTDDEAIWINPKYKIVSSSDISG